MQSALKKDIIKNLRSWHPVIRNDWWLKFSIYNENILLTIVSRFTGQTIFRYFSDEYEACEYINYILIQDAKRQILNV